MTGIKLGLLLCLTTFIIIPITTSTTKTPPTMSMATTTPLPVDQHTFKIVGTDGLACAQVALAAKFNITYNAYNSAKGPAYQELALLPTTDISGSCDRNGVSHVKPMYPLGPVIKDVDFLFTTSLGVVHLDISLEYDSSKLMNSIDKGTVSVKLAAPVAISTVNQSYTCEKTTAYNLGQSVVMTVLNSRMQGFNMDGDFSTDVRSCEDPLTTTYKPTTTTTPTTTPTTTTTATTTTTTPTTTPTSNTTPNKTQTPSKTPITPTITSTNAAPTNGPDQTKLASTVVVVLVSILASILIVALLVKCHRRRQMQLYRRLV